MSLIKLSQILATDGEQTLTLSGAKNTIYLIAPQETVPQYFGCFNTNSERRDSCFFLKIRIPQKLRKFKFKAIRSVIRENFHQLISHN